MTKTTSDLALDSALLYVRSVPESVVFCQKLGFDLTDEIEGGRHRRRARRWPPEAHPVPEDGGTASEGINPSFSVEDVDAHFEHASDAGVAFDFPPTTMSWGARHSYLTDPGDGHTISFVQAPARDAPRV